MGEGQFDEVMADVMPDVTSDGSVGGGAPDWPPDVIPVALWPETTLREALALGVPGVGLARVVAEASDPDADLLAGLSDDALGDLVVACGRQQSWAAGLQARVVAERAARETHPLAHSSLVGQVTGELVVTEPEATEVVVRAESGTRHPSVITALVAGRIDVRKAHTLLRSAAQLTVAERAEAINIYLPQAPRRTWKWLQARMIAFAKDLHGAAETAKTETRRRCVQVDRAENDMGWLTAYLPAPDAAAVWGVVDDMAHQLRHVTGEDRTLSQLRADSLTGIVTGRLLPADRFTDPDTTSDTSTETETGSQTQTGTGATTGTTTGTDPGTTTGTDRATGTDTATSTDPATSTDTGADGSGADGSGTDGSGTDGSGTDGSGTDGTDGGRSGGSAAAAATDAVDAADAADAAEVVDATDVADGPGAPVCTCGGRPPVVQQIVEQVVQEVVQERVQVVRITPTRPVVRVTVPASVLLGLDDAPGDLAGFGPIPAETARLIARDATWQRLLTDPVTGILTDYSTTTYQPGRVLRAAVEARDDTCTFLTCDTPAAHSDLDHIVPFDHHHDPATLPPGTPGQTRAQNLQPLCRKHHLLKTHAGWGVVRDPVTGVTTWTTPTGRTHTRPPTVLDTHVELDQIDPDTSHDLSLQALTGQRLPRAYQTTEPGAIPTNPNQPVRPDQPPF